MTLWNTQAYYVDEFSTKEKLFIELVNVVIKDFRGSVFLECNESRTKVTVVKEKL